MDKATEILLNQSVLGACFVISIGVICFLFGLLWKVQEKRIKEKDDIIAEQKDETHQTFMNYLANVNTLVENNTRSVEKFAEIVSPLKTFLEMLINKRNNL